MSNSLISDPQIILKEETVNGELKFVNSIDSEAPATKNNVNSFTNINNIMFTNITNYYKALNDSSKISNNDTQSLQLTHNSSPLQLNETSNITAETNSNDLIEDSNEGLQSTLSESYYSKNVDSSNNEESSGNEASRFTQKQNTQNLTVEKKIDILKLIRTKRYSRQYLVENSKEYCFNASKAIITSLYKFNEDHKNEGTEQLRQILHINMSSRGRKRIVNNVILQYSKEYINLRPTATINEVVDFLLKKLPGQRIPARPTLNKALLKAGILQPRLTLVQHIERNSSSTSLKTHNCTDAQNILNAYQLILSGREIGSYFLWLDEARWECKVARKRKKNITEETDNSKCPAPSHNTVFSLLLCISDAGIEIAILREKNISKKKEDISKLLSLISEKSVSFEGNFFLIAFDPTIVRILLDSNNCNRFTKKIQVVSLPKPDSINPPCSQVFNDLLGHIDGKLGKIPNPCLLDEKAIPEIIVESVKEYDEKNCFQIINSYFVYIANYLEQQHQQAIAPVQDNGLFGNSNLRPNSPDNLVIRQFNDNVNNTKSRSIYSSNSNYYPNFGENNVISKTDNTTLLNKSSYLVSNTTINNNSLNNLNNLNNTVSSRIYIDNAIKLDIEPKEIILPGIRQE